MNTYCNNSLALFIDSSLLWTKNIDQLMSALTTACYGICSVKPFVNQETLMKFYFLVFIQFLL